MLTVTMRTQRLELEGPDAQCLPQVGNRESQQRVPVDLVRCEELDEPRFARGHCRRRRLIGGAGGG